MLEEYRLGATREGAVIFWQIDRNNKVRTGKVMQYNPEDGHRIKGGQTSAVDWIHSILKSNVYCRRSGNSPNVSLVNIC